jgi:hypothetical protein
MSRPRARVVFGVIVVFALLGVGGAAGAAVSGPEASARSVAVRVVVPDDSGTTAGSISSPPQAAASLVGWSYRDGTVSTGAIRGGTRATTEPDRAVALATSSVSTVSLFGGEITVETVTLRASAKATGTRAGGLLSESALSGVTVLGRGVQPGVNAKLPLEDWGYVVFLEQAVVGREGERLGHRGFVTGVHVHLTAPHGGLPAGSEVLVGYAEAAASAPKTAAPPPSTTEPANPAPPPPKDPEPKPPGAPTTPPPAVQTPPANVTPQLTAQGYVFPVYGPASFTDDFRAGRALTGWHHGNDIFAVLGAPVLAVADGTLFLVGWNDVGGNRLWLRDAQGNEFYYAHLAAYSPQALEGATVRAGDVVGFVGATGDALGTPPHLHFEIHPFGLLWMGYDGVVNPYSYLLAWQRLRDLSFDLRGWEPPAGKAPPPPAVLLQAEDISTASGLYHEGLEQILAMPELFAEGLPGPTIVRAEPGFG